MAEDQAGKDNPSERPNMWKQMEERNAAKGPPRIVGAEETEEESQLTPQEWTKEPVKKLARIASQVVEEMLKKPENQKYGGAEEAHLFDFELANFSNPYSSQATKHGSTEAYLMTNHAIDPVPFKTDFIIELLDTLADPELQELVRKWPNPGQYPHGQQNTRFIFSREGEIAKIVLYSSRLRDPDLPHTAGMEEKRAELEPSDFEFLAAVLTQMLDEAEEPTQAPQPPTQEKRRFKFPKFLRRSS